MPQSDADEHGQKQIDRKQMTKLLTTAAVLTALTASTFTAQAVEKRTKEQACQAQALTSIIKGWPNVFIGTFETFLEGNRCLLILAAPSAFKGKRTIWLIEGKNGDLLAEFYGPEDSDRGLCSYRGGKFKTGECSFDEYNANASQM
jgi:hypothetical protein